ncbi:MAG: Hpt domain-containing protein [Brevirhabdus sp.]
MIDWVRVSELREEIGEDDFAEIVTIFLEEVAETLVALEQAPPDANLQDILHFLKGSALNLGFGRLGELCRTGEQMAENGESTLIDRAEITDAYALSREAFLKSVSTLAA